MISRVKQKVKLARQRKKEFFLGALKFLSSLQKKVGETNAPVERGLMYVDTWINQKPSKSTMVDSGATHN